MRDILAIHIVEKNILSESQTTKEHSTISVMANNILHKKR